MTANFYLPKKPPLKNLVQHVFQTHGLTRFSKEIIFPKGITEIIFDLGESNSTTVVFGGKERKVPKCFITSYSIRPSHLELPTRQTYFGVAIYPGAIGSVFGIPASEFANQFVDLTEVDADIRSLWNQLAESPAFSSRLAVLSKWILRRMRPQDGRELMLNTFLSNRQAGNISVPVLASALCYSPRHLSRKFMDLTGMNTEEVLLLKKYTYSLALMHDPGLSLTAIAHQSHFTDQSHFIKAFRSFTDITPGEYRQKKSQHLPPGHIFHDVR
ncbi:MAG TPA: helix-turn-helix transcriptional regulator [Cyclobacteriaceae bacterium]|nr:helix-turn-helix transcriptional regulator [Cyclobacteriaceae bacterium]